MIFFFFDIVSILGFFFFSVKDIVQALLAFQSFPPYCFVVVSWYLYFCVYGNKVMSYELCSFFFFFTFLSHFSGIADKSLRNFDILVGHLIFLLSIAIHVGVWYQHLSFLCRTTIDLYTYNFIISPIEYRPYTNIIFLIHFKAKCTMLSKHLSL